LNSLNSPLDYYCGIRANAYPKELRSVMTQEFLVIVTASSKDEAATIAEALVSDRLAACVNIVDSIESVYRWEGKIVRDAEALMVIKTTDERYDDLERRVKQLHSYSTPEVIAMKIERGSSEYLAWLDESVRGNLTAEDTEDR